MEREAASKARAAAVGDLHQWSRTITAQTDFERVRASSAISQPIFEFNELSSKLQRAEFGEFAAQRRESIAADQLANAMRIAKRAAISHEKILECHK